MTYLWTRIFSESMSKSLVFIWNYTSNWLDVNQYRITLHCAGVLYIVKESTVHYTYIYFIIHVEQ